MNSMYLSLTSSLRCATRFLSIGLAIALLSSCAQERIRTQSSEFMRSGSYEQAVDALDQGLKEHPDSAALRSGLILARNEALARLLSQAATLRSSGQLDEAEALLIRAQAFDTGGKRVNALLADLQVERRQRQALEQAEMAVAQEKPDMALRIVQNALTDNPRQPELVRLKRKLEAQARAAQQKAVNLGLAESRPISIDFRDASLRTVLDVITRNSGVNFVLDKDVRSDVRVTVLLRSAKVEDAIDLIASTHGLAKKATDSNTILVYPNTPEKQREYQEQVIRVFQLASAEAKGAAAFLRSMMKIRDPHVDERSNTLSMRESPETIELAERLLTLYDSAEPEVLLELEVIEVRSSRLLDLGVKFPDNFSLTVLNPSGGTGGLTWENLRNIPSSRVGVGVGSLLVNFKRELGDVNILANPRIRAKNKEKAKILIGDKVPVITATQGQGGFVSDSVSYLDVGLKLDVEPTVYADDEVAIKVALEVSNLVREVRTASGSLAYQIGTRNASTHLRLRDGETQLLAGLISKEDRSTTAGLPGFADLPVAGRLFSNTKDETQRTELILAITPHIVRNIERPDAAQAEIWVGTDTQTRLRAFGGRVPTKQEPVSADKAAAPAKAGSSGAASSSNTAQPGAMPFAGAAMLGEPARASLAKPAPVTLVVNWEGPAEVKAGEEFMLKLNLTSPAALRGAPMQVQFNKDRLQVMEAEEGNFFRKDGSQTSFTKSIQTAEGRINLGVSRNQATGATGQGTVLNLKLKALTAGAANVTLSWFEPIAINGEDLKGGAPAVHALQVK